MPNPEFIEAVDQALHAYEKIVGEYASRTRQMLERYGYVEALTRIVQSADLQTGFRALRDSGRLADSFEAVVVNFAAEFDRQAVAAARWRLDQADYLEAGPGRPLPR